MTRYVRSRASGYPPDSVAFRRVPWAGRRRLRPIREAWALRELASPSHLRGRTCSGKPRSRPGGTGGGVSARNGISTEEGKQRRRARPSDESTSNSQPFSIGVARQVKTIECERPSNDGELGDKRAPAAWPKVIMTARRLWEIDFTDIHRVLMRLPSSSRLSSSSRSAGARSHRTPRVPCRSATSSPRPTAPSTRG